MKNDDNKIKDVRNTVIVVVKLRYCNAYMYHLLLTPIYISMNFQ